MGYRDVFQKNLPYYMGRANMNQVELAKAVGVTKTTVHYWLTGKAFPRIDIMQEIADALGCSTDDLLSEETGLHESKLDIGEYVMARTDYDIVFENLWSLASDSSKRVTIALLKQLLAEDDRRDLEVK